MLYKRDYLDGLSVLNTAAKMCAAARTAPKAHGKDTLYTLVLTGDEKELLAQKMEEVGTREMAAAMDMVDNRIMYSIGKAAAGMGYVENALWLGIPLSVSGKNIFYDRGIFHD